MGIKYDINENFFDEWDPSMAYLLGLIYADGSLEDSPYIRGKYLRFSSTDLELVTTLKKLIEAEHPITELPSPTSRHQQRYFIRIGSHWLYNQLEKLGLTPKKSLTMRLPLIPSEFFGDFVRGYFDGDGCVYVEKTSKEGGVTQIRRLQTIFVSGSKQFLIEMGKELQSVLALQSIPLNTHHRAFELRYSTSASIKIFKLLYRTTSPEAKLERKFAKFGEYFTLKPQHKDQEIVTILNKHGHVVE